LKSAPDYQGTRSSPQTTSLFGTPIDMASVVPLGFREGWIGSVTLLRYIDAQAERRPQALAVSCAEDDLTYGALLAQARVIASGLLAAGVAPGEIVAAALPRSTVWISTLLGIWFAGAVYLPIDPLTPEPRSRSILERSGARTLVVDDAAPPTAAVCSLVRRLSVNDLLAASSVEALPGPRLDELAYVIFTSGSTGEPKGAMVEHRGLLNHLLAKLDDLAITSRDRIAQIAPISFDISLWQALAALLAGGACYIASDDEVHDPKQLHHFLALNRISVAQLVPTMLRASLEDPGIFRGQGRDPLALRVLSLTGEAAPPSLCRDWLARYPSAHLLNAYGPTECSDDVTHFLFSDRTCVEGGSTPIGRAIRNARLFILQHSAAQWIPTPLGETGELFVAGLCVGRGYLNDERRTSEAFAVMPSGQGESMRIYRTGDLVRVCSDGLLEFVGRVDRQVKIRGVRVELGDIEVQLDRTGLTRGAAVMLTAPRRPPDAAPGERRALTAFVVLAQGADIAQLRAAMRRRVAPAMRPEHYVVLGRLPLSSNGKIDFNALDALQA
jgi:amino acid adenylation domain-containing protein